MVLPIRHRQGLRRAFGLAAATRAGCNLVLNRARADLGPFDGPSVRVVAPRREPFGLRGLAAMLLVQSGKCRGLGGRAPARAFATPEFPSGLFQCLIPGFLPEKKEAEKRRFRE